MTLRMYSGFRGSVRGIQGYAGTFAWPLSPRVGLSSRVNRGSFGPYWEGDWSVVLQGSRPCGLWLQVGDSYFVWGVVGV